MTIKTDLENDIWSAQERLNQWLKYAPILEPIVLEVQNAFLDEEGNSKVSAEWTPTGTLSLTLSGTAADLTKIFGIIRRKGWKLRGDDRPRKNEASWFPTLSRYGMPYIWLFFYSTVCRRVKVGTKLVEEPIYETLCEEDAAAIERFAADELAASTPAPAEQTEI